MTAPTLNSSFIPSTPFTGKAFHLDHCLASPLFTLVTPHFFYENHCPVVYDFDTVVYLVGHTLLSDKTHRLFKEAFPEQPFISQNSLSQSLLPQHLLPNNTLSSDSSPKSSETDPWAKEQNDFCSRLPSKGIDTLSVPESRLLQTVRRFLLQRLPSILSCLIFPEFCQSAEDSYNAVYCVKYQADNLFFSLAQNAGLDPEELTHQLGFDLLQIIQPEKDRSNEDQEALIKTFQKLDPRHKLQALETLYYRLASEEENTRAQGKPKETLANQLKMMKVAIAGLFERTKLSSENYNKRTPFTNLVIAATTMTMGYALYRCLFPNRRV